MSVLSTIYEKIINIQRQDYKPTKIILDNNSYHSLIEETKYGYSCLDNTFRGIPVKITYREKYICVLSNKPKKKAMLVPNELKYSEVVIPTGYYAKFV